MEYPDYDDDAEDYFKDLDNVLSNLKKLRSVHENSRPSAQGLAAFPNPGAERGGTDSSGSDGAGDSRDSGSDVDSEELTEVEDEDDDGQVCLSAPCTGKYASSATTQPRAARVDGTPCPKHLGPKAHARCPRVFLPVHSSSAALRTHGQARSPNRSTGST